MNEEGKIKSNEPIKVEILTDDYKKLLEDMKQLRKEVDYWCDKSRRYERVILKLSIALTEATHEDY